MFSHAEYDTLHEGAGLFDRRARGRLQLTGADRQAYLQGLLTNDILALTAGTGCYAAFLTPQGRMVSDMRVVELGDRTLLDLPEATAGDVRKRLEDFIFSEDVAIEDLGASHAQLGLYGPRAAEWLAQLLALADAGDRAEMRRRLAALRPYENLECRFHEVPLIVVSSDDFGIPGFELFAVAALIDDVTRELRAVGGCDVSAGTVDVTRIEAGRPEFGRDMDEHTIPLEAGIEDRAISLTKGCYVGQEIIIRVLHRGHGRVARRLVGLRADPDVEFDRGDVLAAGGKDVGLVTSAARSPRLAGTIGLGFVHRDYAEPGNVLDVRPQRGSAVRTVTVAATPFTRPEAG